MYSQVILTLVNTVLIGILLYKKKIDTVLMSLVLTLCMSAYTTITQSIFISLASSIVLFQFIYPNSVLEHFTSSEQEDTDSENDSDMDESDEESAVDDEEMDEDE